MALKSEEITSKNKSFLSSAHGGIGEIFSKENFNKFLSIMTFSQVKAGNYLFWEGDESDKLYYLHSGMVKLRKSTEEGKDLILSIMKKGDLLGEYGGSVNKFHGYSAEIIKDAEIGIIKIQNLENLIIQNGDFAVEFLNWIGLNNRVIQSKFRDLLLFGKTGALASTLIRLSNSYGVKSADGIVLGIKLTNTEIADFVGMTRESVNRLFNTWKDEGTIGTVNGHIVIRNMEDLRGICNCPSYPSCPKEICRI